MIFAVMRMREYGRGDVKKIKKMKGGGRREMLNRLSKKRGSVGKVL